jgi:hypothetical protein
MLYKKLLGLTSLVLAIIGSILLFNGCMYPRVEIRATQFDQFWLMECYGDVSYCYEAAKETCPNGYKALGTTEKKDHKTWYVEKLCGSSFGRRVGGQIPMECTADNHYYMEENTVNYTTYRMYVKCNGGVQ